MSLEYEMFRRLLQSTVYTAPQSFYDDFVETNCKIRAQSGLEQLIIRRQLGKCCDWCKDLEGTFRYDDRSYPPDIFKRHTNCNCMVTFTSGKNYQDVWSKKEYDSQRAARIGREQELLDQVVAKGGREVKAIGVLAKEDPILLNTVRNILAKPDEIKVARLNKGGLKQGRFYIKGDTMVVTDINNKYLKTLKRGDSDFNRIMNS